MRSLRVVVSAGLLAGGVGLVSTRLPAIAAAATVRNCVASHLRVSLGAARGHLGTVVQPVVITNAGPACVIFGVPMIQPVVGGASRSRVHVGAPARNLSMGEMAALHVVATGSSVSDAFAVMKVSDWSFSACRPERADGVLVSMGQFVPRVYVPIKITVCTKVPSTGTRLITSGTTGS